MKTLYIMFLIVALTLTCMSATSVYANGATNPFSHVEDQGKSERTREMVASFAGQLGLCDYIQSSIDVAPTAANMEKLPVPTSLREFTRSIYTFSLTNVPQESFVLCFLRNATNESVSDILLWGFTNYALCSSGLPRTGEGRKIKDIMHGRSNVSLSGLRNIETPKIIDKLNKVLRQLINEGHGIFGPGETIDPDRYPEEAKDWLLNYPEDEVRMGMVERWLKSSRPETPVVIRQHIEWAESLPKTYPYWCGSDGRSWKNRYIEEIEDKLKQFEIHYQRWLEDGRHLNINDGSYTDEYWDKYKKQREAERAKERVAQAGLTNNVTTNKP